MNVSDNDTPNSNVMFKQGHLVSTLAAKIMEFTYYSYRNMF